jgi:predicted PurR-regulated permease PerM
MDKMIAIIVMFMVVSFIMAGILITGAIPQIFQTGEIIKSDQATLKDVKRGLIKLYNATTDFIEREQNTTHHILEQQNQAIEQIGKTVNSTNRLVLDIGHQINMSSAYSML